MPGKSLKDSYDPGKRMKPVATVGFGVPATSDPHHFLVLIPRNNKGNVLVAEHLGLQALSKQNAVIDRIVLDRSKWTSIRSEARRAFNARLTSSGLKTASWKVGDNPVDRLLGKELCVLAWAVESLTPELVPIAVRNWLALRPEERWWLFGMTAMSTGRAQDTGKGWRQALQHALGEIVQTDVLAPAPRLYRSGEKPFVRSAPDLFDRDKK